MTGEVLAVDIGGTKMAAALVSQDGIISRRGHRPTAPVSNGDDLWDRLLELLDEVREGAEISGVGIGCGGPMDRSVATVSPLNIPAWRDFPLEARLRDAFPGVPVRLANDAIAMAAAEHWRGAGRGTTDFMGVVISTGVGGGLILDRRVIVGRTGNAGHVGHVVVDPNGPGCACGGRGCLEAIARGPATVEWALAAGWVAPEGQAADGRSLVASARSGDGVAQQAIDRTGNAIGIGFASVVHLLDLQAIAVGGGFGSGAADLLLPIIRSAFEQHVRMPFAAGCRIVAAELGADAGLIGAAVLVAAGDQYWPGGAD